MSPMTSLLLHNSEEITLPTFNEWLMEKAREVLKSIYFCFMDYTEAFDHVNSNKLWKILKREETRSPYLSPEKPVCGSRSNS